MVTAKGTQSGSLIMQLSDMNPWLAYRRLKPTNP